MSEGGKLRTGADCMKVDRKMSCVGVERGR